MREVTTREQRDEWSRTRMNRLTPEQRSEWGRDAGRKGGSIGGRRTAELGKSLCVQRGTCPHCGYESNLLTLRQYHFDHCPRRRIGFVRGN